MRSLQNSAPGTNPGLKRTWADAIFNKVQYENDFKIKNKPDPKYLETTGTGICGVMQGFAK
jgi:hypothetical protein